MAFDVVFFGRLTLPLDSVDAWLATPASPKALWPDVGERTPRSPESVLLGLAERAVLPHEVIEAHHEDGVLTVACFVSNESFLDVRDDLALLFSSAAEFAGEGALTLLGYEGVVLGERIEVRLGQCRLRRLLLVEMQKAAVSPAYSALNARIHERFDSLVGRFEPLAAPLEAEANPFTGRHSNG